MARQSMSCGMISAGFRLKLCKSCNGRWRPTGSTNTPFLRWNIAKLPLSSSSTSNLDKTVAPTGYGKYQPRPWDDYYKALAQFHKEQGHCNVQQHFQTDPSLVYFVKKQRRDRDNLSKEQLDKLNDIDFNWETRTEKQERIWHEKYQQLVEYKHQNGDCDCPTRYLPNLSLGRWVDRQRRLFKNGDLAKERVDLLEGIGFSWALVAAPPRDTSTHDKKWRKQFMKLVDYVNHHGNCV